MQGNKRNRPGSPGTQSQNPMQPTRAGTDTGLPGEEQEEEESGGRQEEEEESTSIRQDGSKGGKGSQDRSPGR